MNLKQEMRKCALLQEMKINGLQKQIRKSFEGYRCDSHMPMEDHILNFTNVILQKTNHENK